jgi:hypothetical protein
MNLSWIKKVYLYLVSLVSLIILIIGGIMLINLALTTWVFPKADNNYYYHSSAPATCIDANDTSCKPVSPDVYEKEAQEQRAAQKQRDAAQALAMIIVATPVFLYHWKLARKEA